ncbi:MAG: hypothetical protein AAF768_12080 [Pseudomonadota bacterium]
MLAIFSKIKNVPGDLLSKAGLIGFVGFLVSTPIAMNLFAILNTPFITEVEMLILAPAIAVMTGLGIFILYLGHKGVVQVQPVITRAAIVPGFFFAFKCGLILSLFVHGADGPWRAAFEGVSGPVADGFLAGAFWPVTFIIGSSIGALVCYRIVQSIKRRLEQTDTVEDTEQAVPFGT